ncbi:hypothetical protein PENTCL1PPCAC_9553, partial [Pristionchus entomophagus]
KVRWIYRFTMIASTQNKIKVQKGGYRIQSVIDRSTVIQKGRASPERLNVVNFPGLVARMLVALDVQPAVHPREVAGPAAQLQARFYLESGSRLLDRQLRSAQQ